MSEQTITPIQNSAANNKKSMLLILAAFAVPVALAYIVLKSGLWQSRGTVNNGTLINPPIEFDTVSLSQPDGTTFSRSAFNNPWWIMFIMPPQCDAACKNALYEMRQIRKATGPDQSRVSILVIEHEASDTSLKKWFNKEFPGFILAKTTQQEANSKLLPAALSNTPISQSKQLFLIDPMGWLFMTYPSYEDEKTSIQKGKGILKDLKRVLKLSRIG